MQQYNHRTILPSEINEDYFNAITDSINDFTSSENKMEKRIKLYNQFVSTKNKLISQPNHHYEPLSINKINYIAILTLEKLGINTPSQDQIDTMEGLIMFVAKPKHLMNKKYKCI